MMRLLTPFLALLFAIPLHAQTFYPVAHEGDTVKATATVRYGSPLCTPTATVPCWVQVSVSGQFVVSNSFFKSDPAPNIVKELDVLQTSVAQTITVNGVAKQVPALQVVVVVPPPVPPVAKQNYVLSSDPANLLVLTINSDGTWTLSGGGKAVRQ